MSISKSIPLKFDKNALLLFVCGASVLYWELLLIRWLSACIRIVAYYSNFVLIAAFFGLGAGALLTRFSFPLKRFIFPLVTLSVLTGIMLSGFAHVNPGSGAEDIWLGSANGISLSKEVEGRYMGLASAITLLSTVYVVTAIVFLVFGQWLGQLFKNHSPLWAYSVEVAGSICGIVLFALLSMMGANPLIWFIVGFILLFIICERNILQYVLGAACLLAVVILAWPTAINSVWTPYYRIQYEPLTQIQDKKTGKKQNFEKPFGYAFTVNNDYHQMLLNLGGEQPDLPFFRDWMNLYDFPYQDMNKVPEGPILIVGAGTGNDVSAALRNTRNRRIVACEIDPEIIRLGKQHHFEKPYENPRVHIEINDARTFFENTNEHFAMVVFGFLDSHTLLSSFSSIRLDNFVYTLNSLEKTKDLLVPGGKVYLTFASNSQWIHDRFVGMLNTVFGPPSAIFRDKEGYTNGFIYMNQKKESKKALTAKIKVRLPTDDWPFLYLEKSSIPPHYMGFIGIALLFGAGSLLLLPRTERKLRLPYFFLGAAFFLVETTNVVSLSLMYGSTWYVNITVFIGILTLVLLGNWTIHLWKPRLNLVMVCLTISIGVAYAVPTSSLLTIQSNALQAVCAVLVFLGPVYFASLIFATLIKNEKNLYQAYGSNILGAVVGGVCEYLSLVFGFKFLIGIALAFYLLAYLSIKLRSGSIHGLADGY